MKLKILLIPLLMFLVTNPCWSDTKIQMEEYGGVYRIPCTVNGAKMKFIFDTGASNVSISLNMAEYLLDNEFISYDDIVDVGQSQTADGRIVDHIKLNLREIEIGGFTLNNVEAIVLSSQNAPLLLGQSAIQKLGNIKLEGNVLIISGGKDGLSDEEVEYYAKQADKALANDDYLTAENNYAILYENDALSDYGISEYARACNGNGNYKKAIELYRLLSNSQLIEPSYYNPVSAQFNIFVNLAHAYVSNDQPDWGKVYIEKGLELPEKCDYSETKLNSNKIKQTIAHSFAVALMNKENYSDAADYYFKTLGYIASDLKLTPNEGWKRCISTQPLNVIKHESLLDVAANYAECQWYSYRWSDEEFFKIIKILARNGSNNARIFCNRNNVKY